MSEYRAGTFAPIIVPKNASTTCRDRAEDLLSKFPGIDSAELLKRITGRYFLDLKYGNKREERAACEFLNLLQEISVALLNEKKPAA